MVELEEQLRQNDRLSVIGELSASLAHEIRNPLTSMRGAIEIIKNEAPPNYKNQNFSKLFLMRQNVLGPLLKLIFPLQEAKQKIVQNLT